jgi:hypothetical protein
VSYVERPTLPDRDLGAPASVRVLALGHYLVGLGLVGFAWYVHANLAAAAAWASAGLVVMFFGRKLHRGRRWARTLLLAASAVALGATLYAGSRTYVLFGLVCPVLYLVLLNTPAARAWFRADR